MCLSKISSPTYRPLVLKEGVKKSDFDQSISDKLKDNVLTRQEFNDLAKLVKGGEKSIADLVNSLDLKSDIDYNFLKPNDVPSNRKVELIAHLKVAVESQDKPVSITTKLTNESYKDKIIAPLSKVYIWDSDVDVVLSHLNKLSPEDFKKAIEQMQKDNVLDDFLNNFSDKHSEEFLKMGLSKGLLKNGPNHPTQSFKSKPPQAPTLIENNNNLPLSLQKFVHKENVNRAEKYTEKYRDYTDTYLSKLHKCNSESEIRALGRPIPQVELSEPGNSNFAKNNILDFHDKSDKSTGMFLIHKELSKKIYEFKGEVSPGTFSVSVEGKAGYTVAKMGKSVGGEVKVDDRGNVSTETKSSESYNIGAVGYEREKSSSGTTEKVSVDAGVVKVTVSDNGEVELEAGAVEKEVKVLGRKVAGAGASSYAKTNPNEATFSQGVKVGAQLGSDDNNVNVEGSMGVNVKGITAKEITKAMTGKGFQWDD